MRVEDSLVAEAVAGVVLKLVRLHLLAILAALARMQRLIAVRENHILADFFDREIGFGAAAVVLAARAQAEMFLAG